MGDNGPFLCFDIDEAFGELVAVNSLKHYYAFTKTPKEGLI